MSRALPRTARGVAQPILDHLGQLAPDRDRERVLSALDEFDPHDLPEFCLEVALPPDPPGCDLGLLVPSHITPGFVPQEAARSLASLVRLARVPHAVWEHDTSRPIASSGAYVRCADERSSMRDHLAIAREAAAADSGVLLALDRLEEACSDALDTRSDYLGFFPDRYPHPVAATRIAVTPALLPELAARISARVDHAVDLHGQRASVLLRGCQRVHLAISADADGTATLAVEYAHLAWRAGLWQAVFAERNAWGQAADTLASLASIEAVRRFDAVPPAAVMIGINHLKVGPGSRVKAYVRARLVTAG